MTRSIAIIGQSHAYCLMLALQQTRPAMPDVHAISAGAFNLNEVTPAAVADEIISRLPNQKPDAICLIIGGNEHNALGLIEHPEPFSVGCLAGIAPPDPGRRCIPRSVMADVLRHWLGGVMQVNAAIFDKLPEGRRLILSPPPPVSDWEHVVAHPGIFGDRLHLGPAPDALRLQLFEIQLRVLRDFAASVGAAFVEAPGGGKDERGFLARNYYSRDPTHANGEYGKLMLKDVLECVEALP